MSQDQKQFSKLLQDVKIKTTNQNISILSQSPIHDLQSSSQLVNPWQNQSAKYFDKQTSSNQKTQQYQSQIQYTSIPAKQSSSTMYKKFKNNPIRDLKQLKTIQAKLVSCLIQTMTTSKTFNPINYSFNKLHQEFKKIIKTLEELEEDIIHSVVKLEQKYMTKLQDYEGEKDQQESNIESIQLLKDDLKSLIQVETNFNELNENEQYQFSSLLKDIDRSLQKQISKVYQTPQNKPESELMQTNKKLRDFTTDMKTIIKNFQYSNLNDLLNKKINVKNSFIASTQSPLRVSYNQQNKQIEWKTSLQSILTKRINTGKSMEERSKFQFSDSDSQNRQVNYQ